MGQTTVLLILKFGYDNHLSLINTAFSSNFALSYLLRMTLFNTLINLDS